MSEELTVWMKVGKLAYTDTDYEGLVALDQCKRGVERLGVTWEEVQTKCRKRRIVDCRRLCCSHLRAKGWTYDKIAEALGYTNHATALHHVRMDAELINYNYEYRRKHLKFLHA